MEFLLVQMKYLILFLFFFCCCWRGLKIKAERGQCAGSGWRCSRPCWISAKPLEGISNHKYSFKCKIFQLCNYLRLGKESSWLLRPLSASRWLKGRSRSRNPCERLLTSPIGNPIERVRHIFQSRASSVKTLRWIKWIWYRVLIFRQTVKENSLLPGSSCENVRGVFFKL